MSWILETTQVVDLRVVGSSKTSVVVLGVDCVLRWVERVACSCCISQKVTKIFLILNPSIVKCLSLVAVDILCLVDFDYLDTKHQKEGESISSLYMKCRFQLISEI